MQDIPSQDIAALETPAQDVFIAPSIHQQAILRGASYTHHSAVPENITHDLSTECVLGVDEAGRGPVLGNSCNSWNHTPTLISIKRANGLWTALPSSDTTSITSRTKTSL